MIQTQNDLTKGLFQDTLASQQPEHTYRFALNAIHESNSSSGNLRNEESTRKVQTFEGQIVGTKRLPEHDASLLFIKNEGSEIWKFDHNTYQKELLARDSDFGCDWEFSECEWIKSIEIKYLGDCRDMVVYWSSGCTYRRVNLTEITDPNRSQRLTCEDFLLFQCLCTITPKAQVIEGGTDLPNGAYQFVAQMQDETGETTNWFSVGQPVYLGSATNRPGERSQEAIRVTLDRLSAFYNKVNLAVIQTTFGSKQVYFLDTLTYTPNGIIYDYYGTGQHARTMDLDEILVKRKAYIRGKDLVHKDNKLFLYNIRQEKNVHYQPYVNQMRMFYEVYKVPWHVYKKDPERFMSLMRDEVYAFGVQLQFCDGTLSPVFHLPGPKGEPEDCLCAGTSPVTFSRNTAKPLTGQAPPQAASRMSRRGIRNCGSGVCTPDGTPCAPGQGVLKGACVDCAGLECRDGAGPCTQATGCVCDESGCVAETSDGGNGGSGGSPGSAGTGDPKRDAYYAALYEEMIKLRMTADQVNVCAECANGTDAPGDFRVFDRMLAKIIDSYTDLFRVDSDPKANNDTIKDSSNELYDEVVFKQKRSPYLDEDVTFERPENTTNKRPETAADKQSEFGSTLLDDDCIPQEYVPEVVARGNFGSYLSCHRYPETLDCDGNPIYGELAGTPVRHFRVPKPSLHPHYQSFAWGVRNQKDPSNDEYHESYVFPIGVRLENIQLPPQEELPKPLCPEEPLKLVMVKREGHDTSVIAKGLFTGTFLGNTYGKLYYYPKHAVNSWTFVDRHIERAPGDSHIGELNLGTTAYMFHSPETNMKQVPLGGQYVVPELEIWGSGYRYGMYASGTKVTNAYENQIDQRGTRQAINLSQRIPLEEDPICIQGQSYAPSDAVLTSGDGITYPLNNAYREKSVLVELEGRMPLFNFGAGSIALLENDQSFIGDGLIHDTPITEGRAHYGSLRRNTKCQYGSVETMRYIGTGLVLQPGQTSLAGLLGDTFIAPYAFKRTAFISNKVGSGVSTDDDGNPVGGGFAMNLCGSDPGSRRDVCDPINEKGEKVKDAAGFADYTRAPINGDGCDARNYANIHPGRFPFDAEQQFFPEADYYYPATLTTLVHYWVETTVNLAMRPVGSPDLGEVHFDNLQGLDYDSAVPAVALWENAWMNQFYYEVTRPSRWQAATKAFIRTVVQFVIPMFAGAGVATGAETPFEFVTDALIYPFLMSYLEMFEKGLFDRSAIGPLLGIETCRLDSNGGLETNKVRGITDNYHAYNPDFSTANEVQPMLSMPDPYNTCACDDCPSEVTLEILFSNPQILTSNRDAWRNFKANNYFRLPARTGNIQQMYVLNGQFMAHTTDGLWILQYNNGTVQLTNARDLLVGGNDLLVQPQQLQEQVPEGFMGTTDPNATEISQLGALFVDRESRKLIRYHNNQVVDLTLNGMRHFFQKYLSHSPADCIDERNTHYYLFGVDYRHNRILFTKRGDQPFTLSYDYLQNKWISFHAYLPDGYLWDRGQLFSWKDNAIWLHNQNPGNYQVYHGKFSPFVLELIINQHPVVTKEFGHLVFDTEARKGPFESLPVTFNKAFLSNHFQGSGELILVPEDERNNDGYHAGQERYPIVSLTRKSSEWRLSDIRDALLNPNSPIWQPGFPYKTPNFANFEVRNNHLQNSILFDKHVSVYLVFDTHTDHELIVKYFLTQQQNRPM